MKLKKTLILGIALLGLTSCQGRSDRGSSIDGSSIDNGSTTSISEVTDITFPEDVTISDDDAISEMSVSGIFIDLSIGTHLVVNKEYNVNFSFPSSFKGQPVFECSQTGILNFELVSGTTYKMTALKQGGTILTIKDEDGIMYYRNAINARNKLTKEQVLHYAVNEVNYYESQFYNTNSNNYKIMFETESTAIFQATEDGVYLGNMDLELTYVGENDNAEYSEYEFSLTYEAENEANTLSPSYLNISTVADIIHFGNENGIYDFFKPVEK